jgi:hypothetical protein
LSQINNWYQENRKQKHIEVENRITSKMSHNKGAADKSFIIETPFTKEDIDKLVMKLPSNKTPGSDGFNGLFLKKCT